MVFSIVNTSLTSLTSINTDDITDGVNRPMSYIESALYFLRYWYKLSNIPVKCALKYFVKGGTPNSKSLMPVPRNGAPLCTSFVIINSNLLTK